MTQHRAGNVERAAASSRRAMAAEDVRLLLGAGAVLGSAGGWWAAVTMDHAGGSDMKVAAGFIGFAIAFAYSTLGYLLITRD